MRSGPFFVDTRPFLKFHMICAQDKYLQAYQGGAMRLA